MDDSARRCSYLDVNLRAVIDLLGRENQDKAPDTPCGLALLVPGHGGGHPCSSHHGMKADAGMVTSPW